MLFDASPELISSGCCEFQHAALGILIPPRPPVLVLIPGPLIWIFFRIPGALLLWFADRNGVIGWIHPAMSRGAADRLGEVEFQFLELAI